VIETVEDPRSAAPVDGGRQHRGLLVDFGADEGG